MHHKLCYYRNLPMSYCHIYIPLLVKIMTFYVIIGLKIENLRYKFLKNI